MKAQISKKIGASTFQFVVEGQKEIDTLEQASLFSSMPDTCTLCHSTEVELSSNKSKGFTFVKIKCLQCNARAQLGQYKEGGCFWKEFEKYTPPTQERQ